MYLAERVSKIIDIHGKVPLTMEGTNLSLQDYLSASNYKHNWGDSMAGFYNTEIYIYDLKTKLLGRVELDDSIKPTFPRWIDDNSICFTGYDGSGFPSMLKWCMNKKGGVYAYKNMTTRPVLNFSDTPVVISQELKDKFSQAPIKVSGEDQLAFLPIPSPEGDSILFQFVSKRKDTCRQVAGLKLYTFDTTTTTLVLPDQDVTQADGSIVHALWSVQGYVSDEYFWTDKDTVVFASTEKSSTILNQVNVKTGERKKWRMSFDFSTEFAKILAFDSKGGFVFRIMNFYNFSTLGYVSDVTKCFDNNGEGVKLFFEKPRSAAINSATITPGSMFEEIITHEDTPDVEAYFWGLKDF
jgi:hypothetical protein